MVFSLWSLILGARVWGRSRCYVFIGVLGIAKGDMDTAVQQFIGHSNETHCDVTL